MDGTSCFKVSLEGNDERGNSGPEGSRYSSRRNTQDSVGRFVGGSWWLAVSGESCATGRVSVVPQRGFSPTDPHDYHQNDHLLAPLTMKEIPITRPRIPNQLYLALLHTGNVLLISLAKSLRNTCYGSYPPHRASALRSTAASFTLASYHRTSLLPPRPLRPPSCSRLRFTHFPSFRAPTSFCHRRVGLSPVSSSPSFSSPPLCLTGSARSLVIIPRLSH